MYEMVIYIACLQWFRILFFPNLFLYYSRKFRLQIETNTNNLKQINEVIQICEMKLKIIPWKYGVESEVSAMKLDLQNGAVSKCNKKINEQIGQMLNMRIRLHYLHNR